MAGKNTAGHTTSGQKKPWIRRLLVGGILIAVFLAVRQYQTWGTVTGQAPDIRGRDVDGTTVSLRDFRGRPVLLHFWASWCPVCRLEQDSIQSIARDHALISIALDDSSVDEIRRWMAEEGVSYRVILDPSGRLAGRFGVKAVPTSMIIDANGEIRFVEVGYTTEIGLRLRLWWVGG